MNPVQVKTFVILFFLSIFRPVGLVDGLNVPVGPLSVMAAIVMFVNKVNTQEKISAFWQQFKVPLLLLIAYTTLCLLSLIYNYDRYGDVISFLRWGLVFIIGQSFLPLCVFLFILSETNINVESSSTFATNMVAILILSLIPFSVLLQVHVPDIAASFMTYFVGGDLKLDRPIRGVLATSTDLGAICGILCLVTVAFAAHTFQESRIKSALFALFSTVLAYVGLLSESRNFILFVGVAAATLCTAGAWLRNRALLLTVPPAIAIASYFSAYLMPSHLLHKLGKIIPHFKHVHEGAETSIVDLLPRLALDSLGGRAPIWESALRLIMENPLLGVSNGGFRFSDECDCPLFNTHNILLQSAVDAGVLGAVMMSAMLAYIIKKSMHDTWSLALILGIIATLMVDNFTDHSYAWIVVASFGSVVLAQRGLRAQG